MNLLDAALLLFAIGVAYGGWRGGFSARALGWVGLVAGGVIAALFVDDVANALRDSTPRTRLLGALAFLVLVSLLGQIVGTFLGVLVRRWLPPHLTRGVLDRSLGAAAGLALVVIGIWLLTPALSSAPGWPARATRGSVIVRAVDRVAPAPPNSLSALGRLVGDAPFPEVFARLTSPDAGPPPEGYLAPEVLASVRTSVVRLDGEACARLQQGSGVVVAEDLVLTNAHVVAGEEATTVSTTGGRRVAGTVVGFDPARDLALVRAPGLGLAPLPRGSIEVDATGSVIGYPGGGTQLESPARVAEEITANGTDIYRESRTSRAIFVLAAQLEPGDSGGPLIDQAGVVVGLAFAVDPGSTTTAYALTDEEIDRGLASFSARGTQSAVDTGRCLVG